MDQEIQELKENARKAQEEQELKQKAYNLMQEMERRIEAQLPTEYKMMFANYHFLTQFLANEEPAVQDLFMAQSLIKKYQDLITSGSGNSSH